MTNLKILLTLGQHAKAIPYPATAHDDGTRTHAFTSLKGNLALVRTIEEAKGIPAYTLLLNALNAVESPFFSVGCEKAFNSDRTGHWASGFMEFAFNFAELVGDAANYFALFYHFNDEASDFIKAHHVQFHWIIQPARFTDGACDGFTCAVWITTAQCASAKAARQEWDAAVGCFCDFISTTKPYAGSEMYAAVA